MHPKLFQVLKHQFCSKPPALWVATRRQAERFTTMAQEPTCNNKWQQANPAQMLHTCKWTTASVWAWTRFQASCFDTGHSIMFCTELCIELYTPNRWIHSKHQRICFLFVHIQFCLDFRSCSDDYENLRSANNLCVMNFIPFSCCTWVWKPSILNISNLYRVLQCVLFCQLLSALVLYKSKVKISVHWKIRIK